MKTSSPTREIAKSSSVVRKVSFLRRHDILSHKKIGEGAALDVPQ